MIKAVITTARRAIRRTDTKYKSTAYVMLVISLRMMTMMRIMNKM